MDELLTSGRLVAFIALGVLAEFGALALLARRAPNGPSIAGIAATLAAGLCLLMALRSALAGTDAASLGLWLGGAGVAHVADVILRFRR